jgi:hypothetical protein
MPKALAFFTFLVLLSLPASAAMRPDPTGPEWTPAAATPAVVVRAYDASWQRYFGTPAPLPRDFDLPAEMSAEEAFAKLWTLCEPALLPTERGATLSALRWRVLGDETPFLEPLDILLSRGRLTNADLKGPLLYRFLDETVGDDQFLPEVLPPADSPVKLRSALRDRNVSLADFNARFLTWALAKAQEAGLLRGTALTPPSVWALDGGLAPGAFALASLPVPQLGGWLAFEAAGDVDSRLRLATLTADADGRLLSKTLANLPEGRSALAGGGTRVWVVVFNPGQVPASLAGLALTFWNSWEALVEIRESRLDGGACDLLLEEQAGMATYSLWSSVRDGEAPRALAGEFPSEGPGMHRYRILLEGEPPAPHATMRLVGRAATGGEVVVEFLPADDTRRPEPAP